nr:hypothetical protein [Tanacetum cinerariifolium]
MQVSNPLRSFITKHKSIACPADADCSLPLPIKYLVTFWDIWLAESGLTMLMYSHVEIIPNEHGRKITPSCVLLGVTINGLSANLKKNRSTAT